MFVTQQEVDAAVAARRLAILSLARRLVGAHYLWGADGSKPGQGNVGFEKVVLDANQLKKTTFCAAATTSAGQKYVCAGRYRALSVNGRPKPGIIKVEKADTNLTAFIARYKTFGDADRTRAQYGWGAELTPRKVQGKNVIDYGAPDKPKIENKAVWGEGCDDTLHFDCGSFVRYVVWHACQVSILSITSSDLSRTANPWGGLMAREVAKGEPMKHADILVYPGHVAFATEDGRTYDPLTLYHVAQAESAVFGVNFQKLHHQHCTKCIRLSDSTLLGPIRGKPDFLSWRPGGPTAEEVLDSSGPVARSQ